MANEACASCGAAVENATVTGILCQACHTRDVAPAPGWRSYFTGPTYVGLVAVLIPWFVHFTVNTLDYVALAGAVVGILAALAGGAAAIKGPKEERMKKLAPVGVVLLLALLDLRSSGALL